MQAQKISRREPAESFICKSRSQDANLLIERVSVFLNRLKLFLAGYLASDCRAVAFRLRRESFQARDRL
jgi:hypothetical protein